MAKINITSHEIFRFKQEINTVLFVKVVSPVVVDKLLWEFFIQIQ